MAVVALVGAALASGEAGAATVPAAYRAPGGAFQPFGPATLTPAQRAQRNAARRARGLGRPDAAAARRHRQRADRAGRRVARALSLAGRHRARAARLGPGPTRTRLVTLARRQESLARTARQTQTAALSAMNSALSVPTAATCAAPPTPSPYSQYTLPAWSDVAGWGQSQSYYGTIQLADLTGDGAAEVIGRAANGMNFAQLQAPQDVFSSLPLGPPLSDAAGWNALPYALSIRAGDIDGDGQAEVVALNAAGQVVTYQGNAVTGAWTGSAAGPAWSSAGTDWSQPSYYESFQLADLDSNGDMELVALSAVGVIAADYNDQTSTWVALPGVVPLPASEGWNAPPYAGSIRIGDIDGQPGAELVVLNAATPVPDAFVFSYNPSTQQWTGLGASPAWTQAAQGNTNWTNPAYYSTLSLANLVGGPQSGAEIVVRTANGLVVSQWNPQTNGWVPQPTSAVLPDAGGWNLPQFYETMTVGDFDGDGMDEVAAAGYASLVVLSYSAATPASPWSSSSSQPLVQSAWAQAENYETFRAGDVDGDGADELVFRDQYGVRTLTYEQGRLVPIVQGFPAFTGTRCTAYNAIVQANQDVLAAAGLTDIRAAYSASSGVQLGELVVPSRSPNKGISTSTYAAVATQIKAEIAAAMAVDNWHNGNNGMATVIQQGFTPQVGSIGRVTAYFQPGSSQNVSGYILPFLQGIVEAVGLAVAPEGSIVTEEVATGINSVLGSAWNAIQTGPNPQTQFQLNETQDQLQAQVSTMQQQAINGNTTNASLIPREWGLMQVVADAPLPGATEPWQGMWWASDTYFWQQFANAFWSVNYCVASTVALTPCNARGIHFPAAWGFTGPGNVPQFYWIAADGLGEQPSSFTTSPQGSGYPPAVTVLLTGTPSPACTPPFSATTGYTNACLLAVPPSEFYLGQDGWAMPTAQAQG